MSTSPSPQRPLYAWLAGGAVAALIASSVLVSVALASPHRSAPRATGGLTPTAAEAALNILPRPRPAQAESSERSCGHVRLGFGLRCLAGELF